MYEVHIESMEFKGKRTIQQHQLVNQVNYCNLFNHKQLIKIISCVLYCKLTVLKMCTCF